ncbi:MAG: glycosyltransferase family 4 protein [Pyrinomonadaceae bacterium]
MRIAVVNWTGRRVGGTESYLGLILPALSEAGHEVAFWHETDLPGDRDRIVAHGAVPSWDASALGVARAVEELRRWNPDLIYAHGLLSPELEAETVGVAPSVFFAHAYYGTCISGSKTFRRPAVTPCERRFGWRCVLSYYPRGCGGHSPVSMAKEYARQSRRLNLLGRYRAVLTHSTHMREEYLRHGLDAGRVHNLSYYAYSEPQEGEPAPAQCEPARRLGEGGYRLLFTGRMDRLKGGRILLEALPGIAARLGRRVRLTFAGDGPERPVWERAARRLERQHPAVEVGFAGWVARERLDRFLDECDLLVFPSQWPEPFGLAGPEAGARGVPVAAFAVGGISEWLTDGVNGHLAPGDPPTAAGLADAVVRCLADPAEHARLARGAVKTAHRFSLRNHLSGLLDIFEKVLAEETAAAGL